MTYRDPRVPWASRLLEPLWNAFRTPKITIEVKRACWSRLCRGVSAEWRSPKWRETCLVLEAQILNSGMKTAISRITLDATSLEEQWSSLTPKVIDPRFHASDDCRESIAFFWYSVKDMPGPFPMLLPHEPIVLELCFVVPKPIAEEEISCELSLVDSRGKKWKCHFVADEEPLKY